MLNPLKDWNEEISNEFIAAIVMDAEKNSKIADIVEVVKTKEIIEKWGDDKEMLTKVLQEIIRLKKSKKTETYYFGSIRKSRFQYQFKDVGWNDM